jgi:TPP-dependent pyruvate/acetoin dehydrogenase alpha subunit
MPAKKKAAVPAGAPPGSNGFSLISREKLLELYTTMVKCRLLEERAGVLLKQSRFTGGYDAAVGQEASAVGVTIDLRPEDTLIPSHRDFIVNFIVGAPLDKMFAQLIARAAHPVKGPSAPAELGDAPVNARSSTIAAQFSIATGVALANKTKKNGNVAVAFCGEGSAWLPSWHETLNVAGKDELPILFVCQNNLGAEPGRNKLQVEDIAQEAEAYGFPGIAVDGNDVVAVYRVAHECIDRARQGRGPTLIECRTDRCIGNSGIDQLKCRDPEEVAHWTAQDPITNMEKYLTAKGLYSAEMSQEVVDSFNKELDAAIEIAEKSLSPVGAEALDGVDSFSVRERVLNPGTWTPKD